MVGLALAMAVPAAASAAAFTARLTAPNHTPTANKQWPITVTVTRGGARLGGSVRYQFLFQGQVVANRAGHSFTHGVYHDTLLFPGAAVGRVLSLRVIVTTKYGTVDLPWWIKARA
jgi:hypothetical protein